MAKKNKAKTVWVILADPECSSCTVNAVCLNEKYARNWVKKENKALGFEAYWVEQSQLIE